MAVLRRYLWYLTPEIAVFSLFSNKISTDQKSRLASRKLTYKSNIPESNKLIEPKFPKIDEKNRLRRSNYTRIM